MNNIHMVYDFESTGYINQRNAKTCQFAAIFVEFNDNGTFNIHEEVEFKRQLKLSEYLLEHGHKQEDYDNGLTDLEYVNKIKELINKYKPTAFVGANIRKFDNIFLKKELEAPRMLYLIKQHDTLIYERLLLGLNDHSKTKKGKLISCTLEECCKRHGIEFDPEEAHDALYDVRKTFELFLAQSKVINDINEKDLQVVDNNEFNFE